MTFLICSLKPVFLTKSPTAGNHLSEFAELFFPMYTVTEKYSMAAVLVTVKIQLDLFIYLVAVVQLLAS